MLREAVSHRAWSLGLQESGFSLGSDIGLWSDWKTSPSRSTPVRPFTNERWTTDRPSFPLQDRDGITFDFANLKARVRARLVALVFTFLDPSTGTHHPSPEPGRGEAQRSCPGLLCEDVSVFYPVNKASGSFYTGVLGAWRPKTGSRTWSRRLQPFSS